MDSLSFMQFLAECHIMPCHATPFLTNSPREPILFTLPRSLNVHHAIIQWKSVEVEWTFFSIVLVQFHLIFRISSPEEYNVVAIRLSTLLVTDFVRRVGADLFS